MVGKFLLGMVSGGLVVASGLVIGSAVVPLRPANVPAPPDKAAETPLTSPETTDTDAESTAKADAAESTPEPEVAEVPESAGAAPDGDTQAETVEAAPIPEAGAATEASEAAAPLSDAPPAVADASPAPAAPAAETLADPDAPAPTAVIAPEASPTPAKPAETAADVAAALPDPALPEPPSPEAPELADAETVTEALPETAPADTTAPGAGTAETEATIPEAPALPELIPLPDPTFEVATDAGVTDSAPAAEADTVLPAPVVENLPEAADTEVATVDMPGTPAEALPGTLEPQPETADAPAQGGSTFTPAPRLIDAGEGVIVGRGEIDVMPGESPESAPEAGTEVTPDAVADPNTTPEDMRPITRFATAFENPDAKPPMAIVLIDRGAADLDRAGLAGLPIPVSFALDPLDPATPDHAAVYRAAGREVVMLVTGIAEGAQASDVEVAFQSMEQGLPEAVAVMDLAEPAFQNNRQLASAVVPILKAQGRGLLTWDAGLNAADQVARREDLEAAMVFRDLGAAGADKVAIRRLLDRAVFKAGQDGQVSVVGEADPETVAALLEWSVEGKAATVALAPLTAVLTVD